MRDVGGAEPLVTARELLDRVQVAVIVTDLSGRILQCNRQAERTYGLPREQLVGHTSRDFSVETIPSSVIDDIAKHMRNGESWEGEFPTLGMDGSVSLVHVVDTPVLDDDGQLKAIVSASIDITDRWKLEKRLRAEHAAARVLADSDDLDTVAARVLEVLCDALGFQAAGLREPDPENGELRWVQFVGTTEEELPSVVTTPLREGEQLLGVMEFFGRDVAPLDEDTTDMLAAVGTQLGSFIRRRRAERALTESYRERASLAETLQRSLLPPHLPDIDDIELAARYLPAAAGIVGGDFYDVFERARDDWIIVLGDVCGKGTDAAVATALARYTVRAAAMQHAKPRQILGMLNEALLRGEEDTACTAVVARVRTTKGKRRLTIASGGHPLPLHATATGVVTIGTYGTLLGMTSTVHHDDASIELAPGDIVLFYTDGVTDVRRGSELFGDERLVAALAETKDRRAHEVISALQRELCAFSPRFRDDVAMLALRQR